MLKGKVPRFNSEILIRSSANSAFSAAQLSVFEGGEISPATQKRGESVLLTLSVASHILDSIPALGGY